MTRTELLEVLRIHLPGAMPKMKDVAAMYDVTPQTFWNWRKKGALETRESAGGQPYVDLDDLADAIESGKLPAPPPTPAAS